MFNSQGTNLKKRSYWIVLPVERSTGLPKVLFLLVTRIHCWMKHFNSTFHQIFFVMKAKVDPLLCKVLKSVRLTKIVFGKGGASRGRKLIGRNSVNLLVGWCG